MLGLEFLLLAWATKHRLRKLQALMVLLRHSQTQNKVATLSPRLIFLEALEIRRAVSSFHQFSYHSSRNPMDTAVRGSSALPPTRDAGYPAYLARAPSIRQGHNIQTTSSEAHKITAVGR